MEIMLKKWKKAFELYNETLNNGDATSYFIVGEYYLEGKIVKKNADKAIELFKYVVEKKEHEFEKVAFKLGEIYENDKYGKINEKLSKMYYKIAYDNGMKVAQSKINEYEENEEEENWFLWLYLLII